ncbi:SirB2 family protein [Vibrio sp. DW001]|uniref:SirB2 family protein n=1 Tax=Vibrio sp. DW001 TaxID=2912315 RepID=UPI0023B0E6AB|nr:SirB2 family protein [Vibrio sp. DW001]WED29468.1 SirB2 family protein [Vibrio sp. DW001]
MYLEVKTVHIVTVTISISLFVFRFLRYYAASEIKTQPLWLKHLPHVIDTLLFSSGIALVSITKFIPFTASAPWLSYKLAMVVLYIACGFGAMSQKASRRRRILFFIASIGCLCVVITLALTKQIDTLFAIFQ